jgi:muramoyltetrapeptide carboxypeptidase|tara:strand:+ start:1234 stop:2247 length:1014 start_codon:yes stop_codon:yes gene_type:complete
MNLNKLFYLCLTILITINTTTKIFSKNLKEMDNNLIRPEYLKVGDTIAIIAPSGVLNDHENYINKAKKLLESWELNVIIGKNVFNNYGHFSGTDKERTKDFQRALDDKTISAIWCARGGYGAMRIIDDLDYTEYLKTPKWIIGYSDITAIHNDLHILGSESIHSIMCKSLEDKDINNDRSIQALKDVLFGNKLSYNFNNKPENKLGKTSGQIVGGNLTLLHGLIGSKSSINTDGKILFIEDLGEYHYHIDRMLISLKRAGYFDNCNGLVVGDFSDLRKNTTPFGKNIKEIILDAVKEFNFPVLFDFPAGHEELNMPIILGRNIIMDINNSKSTIEFL